MIEIYVVLLLLAHSRLVFLSNQCTYLSREPNFSFTTYETFSALVQRSQFYFVDYYTYYKDFRKLCQNESSLEVFLTSFRMKHYALFLPVVNCFFLNVEKDSNGSLMVWMRGFLGSDRRIGLYAEPNSEKVVYSISSDSFETAALLFKLNELNRYSKRDEINITQQFCEQCLKLNCTEFEPKIHAAIFGRKHITSIVVMVTVAIAIVASFIGRVYRTSSLSNVIMVMPAQNTY